MRIQSIRTSLAAIALSLGLPAAPAAAQSNATYVATTGTDNSNCFQSPCRTLTYALTQTATEGHLHCRDSGNFSSAPSGIGGGFTITRSVTIDCGEVSATVLGTITIDDSATASPGSINVVLRGLRLRGDRGFTSPSPRTSTGIRFVSGYSLILNDLDVANYAGNPFPNAGIHFAPALAARLHIANSIIANNGGSESGPGILIRPTGVGYASVTLENVQLVGNTIGLFVWPELGGSSSTNVVVNRSVISGGNYGVYVFTEAGNRGAGVTVTNSSVGGAAISGLYASGGTAQIRVGTTTIAGNSTGVERASGAVIATYGNNTLIGNGVNGSFNGFPTEN